MSNMTEVSLHGIEFWNLSSVYITDATLSTPTAYQRESDLSASVLVPNGPSRVPNEFPTPQQEPGTIEKLSEEPHPISSSWLNSFVSQLSSWLSNHATSSTSSDAEDEPNESSSGEISSEEEQQVELWEEWEWILSETEKFAIKRTAEDSVRINSELEVLRKNAPMIRMRPFFLHLAKQCIDDKCLCIADKYKLMHTVLDASKRSKIVSDVVNSFAEQWLEHIKFYFLAEFGDAKWKSFTETYRESMYHKGVVGGMKELGWQASHGKRDEGLTDVKLADIGWAIWKTLSSSLRWVLERELTFDEGDQLAGVVGKCLDPLVGLWYCTVTNSELGAAREGVLPAKWAEEAQRERERIEAIKRKGVSARYEYKPVVIRASDRQKLRDLKQFLERHLQFRQGS